MTESTVAPLLCIHRLVAEPVSQSMSCRKLFKLGIARGLPACLVCGFLLLSAGSLQKPCHPYDSIRIVMLLAPTVGLTDPRLACIYARYSCIIIIS